MNRRRIWLLIGMSGVVVVVLVLALAHRGPKLEYVTATVERGSIHDEVEATGSVNAVTTVQVGSQVSGTISKLLADFNTHVRKGEVIARIEPALFHGSLQQAVADSENAHANVIAARANLAKSKAALAQALADYDRTAKLAKNDLVSQQELDVSKATYEGANASVSAAEANVVQASAQLSQKTAAVAVARTNLGYTVIRSPIDGVIVARNVDVGQTVAASLQAPTIFTIAQDLAKMQVYANIDESDVGRIHVGRVVSFKVDAYPKEAFTGTVSQVRMNPTIIQNVVTYNAIIDFANPDLKLFPGMTAYVTIPVASVGDAIKIPNAALHYRPPLPPDQVRAVYRRYGIRDAASEGGDAPDGGGQQGVVGAGGPGVPGNKHARPADDPSTVVVWKRNPGGSVEPIQVVPGITDHAFTAATQVVVGTLKQGDELVTRAIHAQSNAPTGQGARR